MAPKPARRTRARSTRSRPRSSTGRTPSVSSGLEAERHGETPNAPTSPPASHDAIPPGPGSNPGVTIDGLTYRLDGPPRRQGGRTVVTVRLAGPDPGPPLVDRTDLFSFKSRHAFAALVADAFSRRVDDVLGHLAVLLDAFERAQQHTRPEVVVTPERREAAEKLLAAGDLLDRAAEVMEQLGHAGEATVKRIVYLIATSRLLPRPLSGLLLASSGAGKSTIIDVVSALMPAEHVVSVARLTPQSLFYSGADSLRHKLVTIDDRDGAQEAAHALRVLQSRGELTMNTTMKGKSESVRVQGPIATLSGTTSTNLDPQNLTRCIEIPLDDSADQTARVQAAQARTWSGLAAAVDALAWQDAQRLLEPRAVVIPYAPSLTFPSRTTADRRSSAKLLGLVAANAVLHQRQRDRDGQDRIVATPVDYQVIYALLRPLMEHAADGLSPRAVVAYRALLVAKGPASRRDLATRLGSAYNTAKSIIEELVAQELVVVVEQGPPRRYRVVQRGMGLALGSALVDPAALT